MSFSVYKILNLKMNRKYCIRHSEHYNNLFLMQENLSKFSIEFTSQSFQHFPLLSIFFKSPPPYQVEKKEVGVPETGVSEFAATLSSSEVSTCEV